MCLKVKIYYQACKTDGKSVILRCSTPETCGPPISRRYCIADTPFPEFCPNCFHTSMLFLNSVPDTMRDEILASNEYKRGTSEDALQTTELMWMQAETELSLSDELDCLSSQLSPEEGLSESTRIMLFVVLDMLNASFWHDVIEKKVSPSKFRRTLILQILDFQITEVLNSFVRGNDIGAASMPLRPDYLKAKLGHPSITTLAADDRDCRICREQIGVPNKNGVTESLIETGCNHHFGDKCLYHWILENETCPTCRGTLLSFKESRQIFRTEFTTKAHNRAPPEWLVTLLDKNYEII
ncbi:hypothetical protein DL95DRAFT_452642 [Leptodontidium sp. 2 PMI_412]|nr:hypothetical protein DL95DRAFT_452642 [Leptodontidium sp. 2 PMI_412]